jgi:hypothetical protein
LLKRDWRPPDACGIEFTSLLQPGRIIRFPVKSSARIAVETARFTRSGILDNDRVGVDATVA